MVRARARPPRARDMINFDKIFVFLQNLENPVHGKPSLYLYIFSYLGFFLISVLPRKATFVLCTLRVVNK